MKTAFLFPGQGAQAVGMGAALAEQHPAARETFTEANDALGFDLAKLCYDGPEQDLALTQNTQPAILTHSIAALRAFAAVGGDVDQCAFVAGHSLGELTALVAAGALSFADGVRLVHARGRFMSEAVAPGEGAMAAIIGLDRLALEAVCGAGEVWPANFNSPEQTVIAGRTAAVEAAMAAALAAGAKKAMRLVVSGPFHTPLMAPAGERLAELLATTAIQPPRCPLINNAEAAPLVEPEAIRTSLVRQISSPLLWVESVQRLVEEGVTRGYEFGPGRVLAGLIKRIDRGMRVVSVSDPTSLAQAVAG
ncbi:MAG TPA: ACP S-malonyltransferase [bacterium]|jgi:[acyl-carrier-protein] S-malonyltransferase